LGSTLRAILDELEHNGNIKIEKGDNMYMKLGIDKIPEIILDSTDRNRTSPFAFTGNKFEFRAVGSSANVAGPMTVLNLIVADQLNKFAKEVDSIVDKGTEKRLAIVNVLREYIKSSKNVLFEGDGYSQEWQDEAKRRGLNNIKDTPRALNAYISDKTVKAFESCDVLNHRELEARREIMLENYIKKVQIEARVMGDLALNHIIPAAIEYQNKLIANAQGLKALGLDNASVLESIKYMSKHIQIVNDSVKAMIEERKRLNKIEDSYKRACGYCDDIKEKYFETIRDSVDKLELYVDSEMWPLPKYREMLFIR
jgi:glutamine synthetase